MSNSDITKKPKSGAGDVVHTVGKAAISLIPGIGGAAAEIFSSIIVPPLSKRLDEWRESIGDRLIKLAEKVDGFNIENLPENDMFVTTLMNASQVALRNHQKEKLDALCNSVLNAALPNALDDDLQLMFLNFIDALTPTHLTILSFLDSPEKWVAKYKVELPVWDVTTPLNIFYHVLHEMRGKDELIEQMLQDLELKGLIDDKGIHSTMKKHECLKLSHTTVLGMQFLQFITNPL